MKALTVVTKTRFPAGSVAKSQGSCSSGSSSNGKSGGRGPV